jgi:hypothetical protein
MYNVGYYNNAGLSWLSNQTGASMRGYVLYESAEGEPDVPTLAKANGLGDVEVLGGMGPMEIGNRVWEDSDADGVQDADEQPLSGVIVELYDAAGTNLLGTTTTNATGNWYFTAQHNSNYRVRIAATQFNNRQGIGTLAGYYLTLPNRGSTVNQDYSDSDAGHTAAGLAEINITTDDYGSTNHHLDIGLTRNLVVLATAPVELTVQPGAGKWQLNWTAAAGHNYTRFIAERSADGRVFSSLGEKTAVSSNQYQLADNKQTGIQYYRIKAVSSTGDAVYSNIVSANNSNSKEIKIYPNPAINTLQVTLPSELYGKSVSLELLNSSGQLVLLKKSRMFSVSEQLDVLELSRGVYYLRVVADNTVYKVQKIELVR